MLITAANPEVYYQQLADKAELINALFSPLGAPATEVFESPSSAYRMRAEFRLWHEGEDLFYAMFDPAEPRTPVRIDHFNIASEIIQQAMPKLLAQVKDKPVLRRKWFQVEFLSTQSGELLVTMIYHRRLDAEWVAAAQELEQALNIRLIGRSRKQKEVLSVDYVDERLALNAGDFEYRQYEQGFTQPNAAVNCHMLNWACAQAAGIGGDLLELYCGNGNFSLPLSRYYDRVLATEVAKSSMNAARHNARVNGVENLELVRLSAEEVCSALKGEREFRRLREARPLTDYNFSTVFVDPPRAGLDPLTEKLVTDFDHIIYISCNPETLHHNLSQICRTHRIDKLALFDQFPYTQHAECGVHLVKKEL